MFPWPDASRLHINTGGDRGIQGDAAMAGPAEPGATQEALHRDRRLPDERARQRAGRRQAAPAGLRADRRHRPGRHDPLQHLLRPRSTPRTRSTAPSGGSSGSSSASPSRSIGVLGCMAQKDQEQILQRAPHVDIVVGPGQLGAGARAARPRSQDERTPQMAVSLGRGTPARATRSRPASRATTRSASRRCGRRRSRRSSGS